MCTTKHFLQVEETIKHSRYTPQERLYEFSTTSRRGAYIKFQNFSFPLTRNMAARRGSNATPQALLSSLLSAERKNAELRLVRPLFNSVHGLAIKRLTR